MMQCRHPVTQSTEAVKDSLIPRANLSAFDDAAQQLLKLLTSPHAAAQQQHLAVALQAGVLHMLVHLACLPDLPASAVVKLLSICTASMHLVAMRDAFSVTSVRS